MSTLIVSPFARQLWASLRMLLVLTVLVGLAYPLALTGLAQVAYPSGADGSLVRRDGHVVGSELIGQSFTDQPAYFQSRPSAAGDGYDPLASSASNLGPESPDLIAAIEERRTAAATLDGTDPADVAPDALLASALRPGPAHQSRVRRPAGRAGRPRARPVDRAGRRSSWTTTPRAAPWASSVSRGSTCSCSTWPSTSSAARAAGQAD